MRKIDLDKILETEIEFNGKKNTIRKIHEDYCFNKLELKSRGSSLDVKRKDVKKLCCENPFELNASGDIVVDADGCPKIKDDIVRLIKQYNKIFCSHEFLDLYENFRRYKKEWNGVFFIEHSGISVCPYCGMNYVILINLGTEKRAEASLDHYISKSGTEPLALNLYNLVPSCPVCNCNYKKEEKKAIVNPYFSGLEDNMDFVADDIDFYMRCLTDPNYHVSFHIENKAVDAHLKTEVDNHNDVLKLNERYGQFQGIAKSVVLKYHHFGYPTLELVKKGKMVTNLLLCQDLYDDNEPFSKFKNDIWRECEYCGRKK